MPYENLPMASDPDLLLMTYTPEPVSSARTRSSC